MMTYYTIKILLYEIEPMIWRRIRVSGDTTFAKLHTAIQQSMGWKNKELHEFRYGKGKNLTEVIATPHPDIVVAGELHNENDLTIDTFFSRRRLPFRMLYRYDFTEDWVHELTFEAKEIIQGGADVTLLDGARACPPEDCGGAFGYMDALDGGIEWMDDDYDPDFFDKTKMIFD